MSGKEGGRREACLTGFMFILLACRVLSGRIFWDGPCRAVSPHQVYSLQARFCLPTSVPSPCVLAEILSIQEENREKKMEQVFLILRPQTEL